MAPRDDEKLNSSHQATGKETNSVNKNSKQDRQNPNDAFPNDQPHQSHAHETPNNWKQTATVVNCDDQNTSTDYQMKNVDHFASVDHAVATGNRGTTSIQTTFTGQESIFKMISMQVIEMLDQDIVTVESVLPRVQENFSQWGLSSEVIRGVVTGTLVGAVDRWKRGYEAGWRDGAKEVLRSPLLTNLALRRHSPEEPFNDTVEIKI